MKVTFESLNNENLSDFFESFYKDLQKSAQRFEAFGVHKTIPFFGSARTASVSQAKQKMAEAELSFNSQARRTEKEWALLDEASNALYMSRYYEAAESLAFQLAKDLSFAAEPQERYYICTGGGPGIMEAANRGASRAGAPSVGLGIDLELEQGKNHYITPELSFMFNSFLIRQFWFFYYAQAVVVFPGGLGTLDELCALLTLLQTKKIKRTMPIVLFGTQFWKETLNLKNLVRYGTLGSKEFPNIFNTDDVGEAAHYLEQSLNCIKTVH